MERSLILVLAVIAVFATGILRADEAEYEKVRGSYPDSVEGQLELAQWCRENQLPAQREVHLRRVIEIEPDNADARRALGYSKFDGKWYTQSEIMTKRGYQRYKGQWKTTQEIELAENKRKIEAAEAEWMKNVKRWRAWLDTDRAEKAKEYFSAITDPAAVKALGNVLEKDDWPRARALYVEALAKIDTVEAVKELALTSIKDKDAEIRSLCLDRLATKKRPEVVAYYVKQLGDKDNVAVNLAAEALGRMKDASAVAPLIDALVTVHKHKISKAGGDDSTSATFGNAPGAGGLSVGGGPKIIRNHVSNQLVLDALVSLTGQNFGFDKPAWKQWYATEQKKAAESLDARRSK